MIIMMIMIIITPNPPHRRRHVHPVSITRFPLRRFSPGAGLLRNPFVTLSTLRISRGWVRKAGNLLTETGCTGMNSNSVDNSNMTTMIIVIMIIVVTMMCIYVCLCMVLLCV